MCLKPRNPEKLRENKLPFVFQCVVPVKDLMHEVQKQIQKIELNLPHLLKSFSQPIILITTSRGKHHYLLSPYSCLTNGAIIGANYEVNKLRRSLWNGEIKMRLLCRIAGEPCIRWTWLITSFLSVSILPLYSKASMVKKDLKQLQQFCTNTINIGFFLLCLSFFTYTLHLPV